MEDLEQEAEIFRTLGHPVRLAIVDALRGGEQCVCHLENALGFRQAYISQQLAMLKEAGIVQDRRDGWNIYYFVRWPEVFTLLKTVHQAADPGAKSADRPLPPKKLQTGCPCPKCSAPGNGKRRSPALPALGKPVPKTRR
ncbi:MAG: metalloregulator ArsR/SmtB family transcription factor [Anaerolineales bacterium]